MVIHSIEGSDVLESVCEHLVDGSAGLLFGDVMRADVLCTVSHYTARRFLASAEAVGGAPLRGHPRGVDRAPLPGPAA